ncbi:pyridoxal-phosphate dependent enzyme [Haliea sp. E1-2-M8]|uniref:1-aminocyclopropane-1-carboxylate deaminase/D-cysteine desulfhydrase n=1 Tax=Haliea sp. E1-2-M8 TaxID=3064706 RepID=UPI0027165D02|nr:pyridoxal-phosphate dependent enzyme [Haliea sp. E1-2-M8]MDO8863050.1 pyridoxal-phosphate dependent enzyme [Haliea sp. E1-2-M8]
MGAGVCSTPRGSELWQSLTGQVLEGVALDNVTVLRLDRCGGLAPGNKQFKLAPHLALIAAAGHRRVLSFGGAWSNHLHALAAVGQAAALETVGVIRGERPQRLSPTLADAAQWGMQLHFVSRSDYRRRQQPGFVATLSRELGADHVIPEGGAGPLGAAGCRPLAEMIAARFPQGARVVVGVGTGTTLAGLAAALPATFHIDGIVALRGEGGLEATIAALVAAQVPAAHARWRLHRDFHCGGFARADARLRELMLRCDRELGLALEPVYTGKALLALHSWLAAGVGSVRQPVVLVHTGGLQGRRGYPWLN